MTTNTYLGRAPAGSNYLQRAPSPSGLADVVELILDKGLVIDAFVRIAAVGIELITIDARIVIASVDTYLRFAEAVNRLDLTQTGPKELEDVVSGNGKDDKGGGEEHEKLTGLIEGTRDALRDTKKKAQQATD